MAFDINNWDSVGSQPNAAGICPGVFRYGTSDDQATVLTANYFSEVSDQLNEYDTIFVTTGVSPSVQSAWLTVTQVSPTVLVQLSSTSSSLTEGHLWVGDNTNTAVARDFSGLGTVGVGDGTTYNPVPMAGDAIIDAAGTLTILNGRVTQTKIEANSLDGTVVGDLLTGNSIGAIPVVHRINTPGGVSASTALTITHKSFVIDAWCINAGLGTAGDTVKLVNDFAAADITNALDVNVADETLQRFGTISDTNWLINAGDSISANQVDGGGNDSPPLSIFIMMARFP